MCGRRCEISAFLHTTSRCRSPGLAADAAEGSTGTPCTIACGCAHRKMHGTWRACGTCYQTRYPATHQVVEISHITIVGEEGQRTLLRALGLGEEMLDARLRKRARESATGTHERTSRRARTPPAPAPPHASRSAAPGSGVQGPRIRASCP